MLAARPGDLISISETHIVDGERVKSGRLSSDLHTSRNDASICCYREKVFPLGMRIEQVSSTCPWSLRYIMPYEPTRTEQIKDGA